MQTVSLCDHKTFAKACCSTLFILEQLYEYTTKGMGEIREHCLFYGRGIGSCIAIKQQFTPFLRAPDSQYMQNL